MRCKKKTKRNSNWTKWNLKMMIWTQIWRRKKKTMKRLTRGDNEGGDGAETRQKKHP